VIRAVALAAIVVGLVASGCGSDSSGQTTAPAVSIPAITAPTAPTTTAPATSSTPFGATTTNKGGNAFNRKQPDSATNDVPPPQGSPQEAFEKQCEQNPRACG
jgi:ABC-type glycerol-3-phosphate transport system substrate-binding protein